MLYILSGVILPSIILIISFKKDTVFKIITSILSLLIIILSTILHFEDQSQIENLKEYSYVASLSFDGSFSPGNIGGGVETDLSRILRPVLPISDIMDGSTNIDCHTNDSASSTIYVLNKAIENNSKFPFSYALRALCKQQINNESWKSDMETARNILLVTTQISGHNSNHDSILKQMEPQF